MIATPTTAFTEENFDPEACGKFCRLAKIQELVENSGKRERYHDFVCDAVMSNFDPATLFDLLASEYPSRSKNEHMNIFSEVECSYASEIHGSVVDRVINAMSQIRIGPGANIHALTRYFVKELGYENGGYHLFQRLVGETQTKKGKLSNSLFEENAKIYDAFQGFDKAKSVCRGIRVMCMYTFRPKYRKFQDLVSPEFAPKYRFYCDGSDQRTRTCLNEKVLGYAKLP